MRRLSPTILFVIAGVLALLLVAYVFAGGRRDNPDRLDGQGISGLGKTDAEKQCGSPATSELIKRELFRRAAQLRGNDHAAFDKVAAYSVVRIGSPRQRSEDEDLGAISCSGSLALDLPPGVAVVGGRRMLNANIGFALQPAADGSGPLVTLSGADAIIALLATIGQSEREASQAAAPVTPAEPAEPVPEAAAPAPPKRTPPPRSAATPPAPRERARTPPATTRSPPPSPRPAARATASPSFNCRHARTRGEIAVCNDSGLASLDRQMASQFNRAMSNATPAQRSLLQRTRTSFLSYRDSCPSAACMADAYHGRMREISDIMGGRWRPR